jgi:hypothetical protein
MNKNKAFLGAVLLCLVCSVPDAGASEETVVGHETDKYFFKYDKMDRYDGQFENTYLVDRSKGTVTRTRIYDFVSKKILPDETVYRIQKDLLSDPGNSTRYALPAVIRAVGKPDADSTEILVIEEYEVVTARSTSNEVVVSHSKRLP